MSKWAGKYVIGLTGNIGTGKSVVRRMLEHLGAYGIDADALAHRAISRGAPGYQPVVDTFGRWILAGDGEIDRAKLGSLVFSNPAALKELEKIVHPLVNQAVNILVGRSKQSVVVIEAIKLLETDLCKVCDSIWVSYASPTQQLERLTQYRKMSEQEALKRINSQSAQEEKMKAAQVVIKNVKSFEDTWAQVVDAWKKSLLKEEEEKPVVASSSSNQSADRIEIIRGKPQHSGEIAELFNRFQKLEVPLKKNDIMRAFGEKAFLLLKTGEIFQCVIGWQVENLVSRTVDIVLDPAADAEKVLPPLFTEMEKASRDLQCEASLVFASQAIINKAEIWESLGYRVIAPEKLGVIAWQEAAQESMPPETTLLFKQLRKDRVLRPI